MKIADVARAIDVHRNTITLLYDESATRVDLDTLSKLCIFFNCDVDDLLQFVPEE